MRLFFKIILFFCFIYSFGQGGFRTKFLTNGGFQHASLDIFETTPGSYLSLGFSVDTFVGKYEQVLAICNLDAKGVVKTIKKYRHLAGQFLMNPYDTESFRIACKKNNNIYFTRPVSQNGLTKISSIIIKINFNGDTIWHKQFNDSVADLISQKLISTSDGGFLISGIKQGWSNSWPIFILKTDSNGNELWRKFINKPSPNWNNGKSIIEDRITKNIIISGYQSVGPNNNSFEEMSSLTILDSLGNLISMHNYLGNTFTDMIQTKDNMLVLSGSARTLDGHTYYYSPFVMKIDPSNPSKYIWYYYGNFSAVKESRINSISELVNGDILLAGSIDTTRNYNCLARIEKLNPINGRLKWQRLYQYSINDTITDYRMPMSLNLTSDGGWLVPYFGFNLYKNNPLFFVKYDSLGCDSTEIYCKTDVGLKEQLFTNSLIEVYPNPAENFLNIKCNEIWKGQLIVYDIYGRKMDKLELKSEGIELDVSNYNSGIYFLSLTENGKLIATKKIIKK